MIEAATQIRQTPRGVSRLLGLGREFSSIPRQKPFGGGRNGHGAPRAARYGSWTVLHDAPPRAGSENRLATNYIPSSEVARRLGIKRQTLAKWRMEGRGPRGWIYLNPTRCLYPVAEVEAFVLSLADARPEFNFPKQTESGKPPSSGAEN